jgi:hypothetical protein
MTTLIDSDRTIIKIKNMLRQEMTANNMSVPKLAKRMNKHTQLIYRALDHKHNTDVEFLIMCFLALGKTLHLDLVPIKES